MLQYSTVFNSEATWLYTFKGFIHAILLLYKCKAVKDAYIMLKPLCYTNLLIYSAGCTATGNS